MAESEVRAFYTGKNFFITGGTGFVGLCLIEKILRTIPESGKLYLLMRPKKGKDISERLQEFPKNSVFEKLLETTSTDVFNKIIPVAGDVGQEGLGLSSQDRQTLVDNVHVVIHSAATLDFEDNLSVTVKINLLGTRRVMELCKEIKDLKVMVHVSSAYVNSYLTEAQEKIYDPPADTEKIINLVNTLTDQALNEMEPDMVLVPRILKDHPNTYTFTKHLAEHEVLRCAGQLPCTIVRPTMIVASSKEPVAGWTCSKVGPQGFLMGAAKGVVRRLPMCKQLIADYIPVDMVVNQLLVAGWDTAKTQPKSVPVYHCSSSTQNPFRWVMVENAINDILHDYPLKSAVWYPYLAFVPSLWMFRLSAIFVHFLPAILLDTLLRVTGGKPILFRLHRNVWNSLNRLERFIFTEWKFYNNNTRELFERLNKTDQEKYFFDVSKLVWIDYFTNLHIGVRKYLNKEGEKTLPAAKSKNNILFVAHLIWQAAIIALLWYLLATLMGLSMMQAAWAPPIIYFVYSLL